MSQSLLMEGLNIKLSDLERSIQAQWKFADVINMHIHGRPTFLVGISWLTTAAVRAYLIHARFRCLHGVGKILYRKGFVLSYTPTMLCKEFGVSLYVNRGFNASVIL